MDRTRGITILYVTCALCIISYCMSGFFSIRCKMHKDGIITGYFGRERNVYRANVHLDETEMYGSFRSMRCGNLPMFSGWPANFTIDGESSIVYTQDPKTDSRSQQLMDNRQFYANNISEKMKMIKRIEPNMVFFDVGSGLGEYSIAAAMSNMSVLSVQLNSSDMPYLCSTVSQSRYKDRFVLIEDTSVHSNSSSLENSLPALVHFLSVPGIGSELWFNFLTLRLNVNGSVFRVLSQAADFFESVLCVITKWSTEDEKKSFDYLSYRRYVPFVFDPDYLEFVELNEKDLRVFPEEVIWIRTERVKKLNISLTAETNLTIVPILDRNMTKLERLLRQVNTTQGKVSSTQANPTVAGGVLKKGNNTISKKVDTSKVNLTVESIRNRNTTKLEKIVHLSTNVNKLSDKVSKNSTNVTIGSKQGRNIANVERSGKLDTFETNQTQKTTQISKMIMPYNFGNIDKSSRNSTRISISKQNGDTQKLKFEKLNPSERSVSTKSEQNRNDDVSEILHTASGQNLVQKLNPNTDITKLAKIKNMDILPKTVNRLLTQNRNVTAVEKTKPSDSSQKNMLKTVTQNREPTTIHNMTDMNTTRIHVKRGFMQNGNTTKPENLRKLDTSVRNKTKQFAQNGIMKNIQNLGKLNTSHPSEMVDTKKNRPITSLLNIRNLDNSKQNSTRK